MEVFKLTINQKIKISITEKPILTIKELLKLYEIIITEHCIYYYKKEGVLNV